MTQHEQHMEVYMETILGTVQTLCKAVLCALGNKEIITRAALEDLSDALRALEENAISIPSCRAQKVTNQNVADKYLKLYNDSEDMCGRCLRVVSVMCADKGVDEEDPETLNAWSVVKDASGNVLVTVDYWKGDGELDTYQFPVAWLEWPRAQLETHKAGCQSV